MKNGICIIGQGGHSKVIKDILIQNNFKIIAYLDDYYKEKKIEKEIMYAPVSYAKRISLNNNSIKFVVAIGDNNIRKKIVEKLSIPHDRYKTLIHPTAVISQSTEIGYGTVIMPYAVINADTKVGRHSIINTGAVVEHDNMLEDYVHISPNATLTGSVKVQKGAHIGAGATVIPGISIGSWVTVGAGATVINNISNKDRVVGSPAKSIRRCE
ncbi:acetyltransferase [Priestia megaterium]|uniref:acetyltransferase n=1 Tax=Priestia megaterium TaxID=1404 RepID=UPI000BF2A59F|nr:acetyltransferase [Priestia megaterium]PFJ98211.1 acetyltransferase [Priestia megaterium]PMD11384.1 acetyltransferase [Priestia megaterium]